MSISEDLYVRCLGALEELQDHRQGEPRDLASLLWFFVYGQNVYSEFGGTWTGCSFRQDEQLCLLTCRREQAGVAQVAFTTARTPTDCVRLFCQRYREELVQWRRDKYR